MDKRYQVFVSSTYIDLLEERQEVIQALLELDCIPAGMELFPAANDDQWSLIKKVIDDCDYYLVIVGGRYGSTAEATGLSYTQMEYEYALEKGKPIIGFVHKNPQEIPAGKTEKSDAGKKKLEDFRNLVQKKMCKFWSTPTELGSVVSRSLIKLIKEYPAVGWVRADLVPDETTSKEILHLRRQIDDLKAELSSSSTEAPKGTEDFAQGADPFKIRYIASYYVSYKWQRAQFEATIPWDDIFAALAPHMIEEANEYKLKSALDSLVDALFRTHVISHFGGSVDSLSISVFEDDFQTVKIQLRALSLITKSIKNRSVKDTGAYWTLTPYGDTVMTRLRAVKKAPAKASARTSEKKSRHKPQPKSK